MRSEGKPCHGSRVLAPCTDTVIILRTRPVRDADLMLTLFAEQTGKISAVANHARRSRKRFGGALAAGTIATAHWQPLNGTDLVRIDALTPHWTPPLTSPSLAHFAAHGLLLQAVNAMSVEGQTDPHKFSLLTEGLPKLSVAAQPAWYLTHLLLQWLTCCGFAPDLTHCHCCHRAVLSTDTVRFLPHEGGIHCRDCSATNGWSLPIPALAGALWHALHDYATVPPPAAHNAILPLLRVGLPQYMTHIIGKPMLVGPYWEMLWTHEPAAAAIVADSSLPPTLAAVDAALAADPSADDVALRPRLH